MTETFYKGEVEKFQYFKMPKWIYQEPYCDLSLQAKTVYSFLFDRISLSLTNEWYDKEGQIFVIFSNESLASRLGGLNCSIPTIIKAKKELIKAGLLREVRQGLSLPNRLYPLAPKTSIQEIKDFKYRTKNSLVHDVKKIKTNKTEINKTEINNNNNNNNPEKKSPPKFVEIFQNRIGMLDGEQFKMLNDFIETDGMTDEIIIKAIGIAADGNKRNLKYIQSILNNWRRAGLITIAAIDEAERQFQESKQKKYHNRSTGYINSNVPEWSNEDYKNETTEEEKVRLEKIKQEILNKRGLGKNQ